MNRLTILFFLVIIVACNSSETNANKPSESSTAKEDISKSILEEPLKLTKAQANTLVALPLDCIHTEYPNKLGQVIGSKEDLGEPQGLHPAFYGCFDWHSAVHGHWSLVKLLKSFPDIEKAAEVKAKLIQSISKENILAEVDYFNKKYNTSYERTYGWAWLLKLAEELHGWDNPTARALELPLHPELKIFIVKIQVVQLVGSRVDMTSYRLVLKK